MYNESYRMGNQEIIEKLIEDGVIHPIYREGVVDWVVEFPGGAELIGEGSFTWDEICQLYRDQMDY